MNKNRANKVFPFMNKSNTGVVVFLYLNMQQKQFIEVDSSCQRIKQLFIHVCLLRIDFTQHDIDSLHVQATL